METWRSLEDLWVEIKRGYDELGYRSQGDMGFRFLSSPASTFWSEHLILSINPAGNKPDTANDGMCTAEGRSAYVDEAWPDEIPGKAKLQKQYQALLSMMGWNPLEVLQAPFSPYRYPRWADLPSPLKERTVSFCASRIWQPYFGRHVPRKIICVGKPQAEMVLDSFPFEVVEDYKRPTGWNNRACKEAVHYTFANGTKMLQIPHLGVFGIMTANACQPYLDDIFDPLR